MNAPQRPGHAIAATEPKQGQAGRPRIVLSLDFELRWGVHDLYGDDFEANRAVLERVHEAVPALLSLLAATVTVSCGLPSTPSPRWPPRTRSARSTRSRSNTGTPG